MKKHKRARNVNNNQLVFYANNCNKISNKIQSFNQLLSDLKPSIFGLQETKQGLNDPPLKCDNLINYQTSELRREKERDCGGKGLAGGGLAIGALHDLQPVLTRQGDDEAECLGVLVKTVPMDVLCVIGYGPQLGDCNDRKDKFWRYLEEEANTAENKGMGIIIQIDSNAWAGKNIIPGDPNPQNKNGKYLEEFLKSHPALIVVNTLQRCNGVITRHRKTTVGEEQSILDLFIVCQQILPHIKHMQIDHKGEYWLTNFSAKKRTNKVTNFDHYPVILVLDMSFSTVQLQGPCGTDEVL